MIRSEDIVLAVEKAIQDEFRAALDVVQDEWIAKGDAITLASPQTVTRGFTESLVQLSYTAFPRIAILGASIDSTALNSRVADVTHTLILEWNIVESDPKIATSISWRYCQAMARVIGKKNLAGFHAVSPIPNTQESPAMPHRSIHSRKTEPELWIAGIIATWRLKGMYSV